MHLSVIYITHDLRRQSRRWRTMLHVMYAGKIVEVGSVDEIFY